MSRYTIVFPRDGGRPYKKGSEHDPHVDVSGGVMIVGDLPDFISPVDGKQYSGRAGMREHCKRNDVVPNVELKGLPIYKTNSETRSTQEIRADRAARKESIIHLANQHLR